MSAIQHLVAIDLGSNSFHMVIARQSGGHIQIVHRRKQNIFLAQALDSDNNLDATAIDKGISCLVNFSQSFKDLAACSVRVVATQALRQAANSEQFIKAAFDVFPYPIEIISGESEAKLIFQGVSHTQPITGRNLVIDIGGGSTELVIGRNFNAELVDSLPIGSAYYHDRFFKDGLITASAMQAAKDDALSQLVPIADQYRLQGWRAVLGTSGSMKAINLCVLELYQLETITYQAIIELKEQLIRWGHSEKIRIKSLDKHRLPLLAGAVAIIWAIFDVLAIKECRFSSAALREGVLYSLSNSRANLDIRQRTINHLAQLYYCDKAKNNRTLQQLQLFNQQLKIRTQELSHIEQTLLQWALQIHEIGITINSKKHYRHAKYIIMNSDMPGFNSQQQWTICELVANQQGNIIYSEPHHQAPLVNLNKMLQLMRLAIILTNANTVFVAGDFNLHYDADCLYLDIRSAILQHSQIMMLLEKEVRQTAKAKLDLKIIIG